MAASVVALLALLVVSCGTPSNPVVPTGNPDPHEAIQTHGPGAQPTAPGKTVAGPEIASPPGEVNPPLRTPGEQPADPGPLVVGPTPAAPPTLIAPDHDPTATSEPSEQLPIPQVP